MALVQTAEYQYFRSLFEDVLTTLERVDVDALDPGLRSTVPSLRGSALKQLERDANIAPLLDGTKRVLQIIFDGHGWTSSSGAVRFVLRPGSARSRSSPLVSAHSSSSDAARWRLVRTRSGEGCSAVQQSSAAIIVPHGCRMAALTLALKYASQ